MSEDARLRRRRRDLCASDTPEGRVLLLKERLRAGDISAEELDLLAYCGDPAALELSGASTAAESQDAQQFVQGLARWGITTCVESAVHAFSALQPIGPKVSAALALVSEWVSCPCDSHAASCERVGAELERTCEGMSRTPEFLATSLAAYVANAAGKQDPIITPAEAAFAVKRLTQLVPSRALVEAMRSGILRSRL